MAGIYVHIPFCKQKCTYCDFHFSTTFHSYKERMVRSLISEIRQRKDYLGRQIVETIYFGGGTPSLLSVDDLNTILKEIRDGYLVSSNPEITLETNPDDINSNVLSSWLSVGINRLSIGIQSYRQQDLDWMNRAHNVTEAISCVSLAQEAGFKNITVDLIYGLPNYTTEEWKQAIQTTIAMGVQHISAYCLTVEQRTALKKMVDKGELFPADDYVQSEHFLTLIDELEKAHYQQYEISNFALPGYESSHNSNYWKSEPYLGVGPSAHSFDLKTRRWNVSNNQQYMDGIDTCQNYWEEEHLSHNDIFNEMLLTGLRTTNGVNLDRLKNFGSIDGDFKIKINEFKHHGWILQKNSTITLSKEGRLKADFIAAELFCD